MRGGDKGLYVLPPTNFFRTIEAKHFHSIDLLFLCGPQIFESSDGTFFHALKPGKYSGESRFSIKMALPDKVEDHMTPRNCSTFDNRG